MVEWSRDMYVNPNLQANLGKCVSVNVCVCQQYLQRARGQIELTILRPFFVPAGQEHPPDSEGAELKLPEPLAGRRDSISSLDSTVSSSVAASQADHPEQYEVIKQQKDIIEHGIDL